MSTHGGLTIWACALSGCSLSMRLPQAHIILLFCSFFCTSIKVGFNTAWETYKLSVHERRGSTPLVAWLTKRQ